MSFLNEQANTEHEVLHQCKVCGVFITNLDVIDYNGMCNYCYNESITETVKPWP